MTEQTLRGLLDAGLSETAKLLSAEVQWWGSSVADMPAASAYIAANTWPSEAEQDAALVFYGGDQWPHDVLAHRKSHSRPVLVVNRLPELVAAALAKQQVAEGCDGFQPAMVRALVTMVVRNNKDAQMLYNYAVSAFAELLAERGHA